MQDLFESAKRAAGNAVERAAWEADKLRRVTARQHEVELLQRERGALVEQLAGIVLDLSQRGQLPPGPLQTLADRLRTLDAEANRAATDIKSMRNEPYVPGAVTISVHRRDDQSADVRDTLPCPTCGRRVRRGATFCSACGTRLA